MTKVSHMPMVSYHMRQIKRLRLTAQQWRKDAEYLASKGAAAEYVAEAMNHASAAHACAMSHFEMMRAGI